MFEAKLILRMSRRGSCMALTYHGLALLAPRARTSVGAAQAMESRSHRPTEADTSAQFSGRA